MEASPTVDIDLSSIEFLLQSLDGHIQVLHGVLVGINNLLLIFLAIVLAAAVVYFALGWFR